MILSTDYLTSVLNQEKRRLIINHIQNFLQKNEVQFDSFVGRGVSGISIASMLSFVMDKGLITVRKDDDGSHSSHKVEGVDILGENRLIIIDDLVCSGTTIKEIISKVTYCCENNRHMGRPLKCKILGAILYHQDLDKDSFPIVEERIKTKILLTFNYDQIR